MPTAADILAQMSTAAREAIVLAGFWHVLLAAACVGLFAGWRPPARVAALLLVAPLASVVLVGIACGNPFNAALFAFLAIAQVWLALRSPAGPVRLGTPWAAALGMAMIGLGWTYPHFLESYSWPIYLVAAPVGVVPCATLYVVIGFALMGGGIGSRFWRRVLAAAGLFYGIAGVWQLGVELDAGLIIGASVLLGRIDRHGEAPAGAGQVLQGEPSGRSSCAEPGPVRPRSAGTLSARCSG